MSDIDLKFGGNEPINLKFQKNEGINLILGGVGAGSTTFNGLLDTPNEIEPLKFYRGNAEGTKLEQVASSASVSWDGITGDQSVINLSGFTNDSGFIDETDFTSHTGDTSIHFTQASISIPASQISDFDVEVANNSSVTLNTTHRGLTNNPHDVNLSDVGGTTNHTALSNIGTNSHIQLDSHLVNVSNPHSVGATQISDFDTEVSNNSSVVLNTTHRTSDGKDHSDVVLNNSHRANTNNPHSTTAVKTPYDNTDSDLSASNVKTAIDELDSKTNYPINTITSDTVNPDPSVYHLVDASSNEVNIELPIVTSGDERWYSFTLKENSNHCNITVTGGSQLIQGLNSASISTQHTQVILKANGVDGYEGIADMREYYRVNVVTSNLNLSSGFESGALYICNPADSTEIVITLQNWSADHVGDCAKFLKQSGENSVVRIISADTTTDEILTENNTSFELTNGSSDYIITQDSRPSASNVTITFFPTDNISVIEPSYTVLENTEPAEEIITVPTNITSISSAVPTSLGFLINDDKALIGSISARTINTIANLRITGASTNRSIKFRFKYYQYDYDTLTLNPVPLLTTAYSPWISNVISFEQVFLSGTLPDADWATESGTTNTIVFEVEAYKSAGGGDTPTIDLLTGGSNASKSTLDVPIASVNHATLGGVVPASSGVPDGHIDNKFPIQYPELTTTERDLITPNDGMRIYNTTTGTFQNYDGGWADDGSGGGFTDPMTTRGDVIYRNTSNVSDRLPIGANGEVLISDGVDVSWGSVGGTGTVTSVTSGDGMDFSEINSSGDITLGTPGTTNASSTNAVTSVSHTHELDETGISITASQVSDFDVEVSNNSAVTLNTAKITNATHTGEVTGSTTLTIANDTVTYAKMQNVLNDERILGRVSGAGGNVEELTANQVRSMINVEDGAESNNLSDANATDLTDGNDTTLHDHDGISENTTHRGLTAAHGTTGNIVGTTDTQSLTNKTLTDVKIDGKIYLDFASNSYFEYNSGTGEAELFVGGVKKASW